MHIVAKQVQASVQIPMLHIADATAEAINESERRQLVLYFSAKEADSTQLLGMLGQSSLGLNGSADLTADLRTFLPLPILSDIEFNGSTEITMNDGAIMGIDLPSLLASSQEGQNGSQVIFHSNE